MHSSFAQALQSCSVQHHALLRKCVPARRTAAVSEYRGEDEHVIEPVRSDIVLRIVYLADAPPSRPPRIVIGKIELPMTKIAPLVWVFGDGVHLGGWSKFCVHAFQSGTTLVQNMFLDDEREEIQNKYMRWCGMGFADGLAAQFPLQLPPAVYVTSLLCGKGVRPLRVGQPVDDLFATDRLEWQVGDAPFTFSINKVVHTAVTKAVMRAVAVGALGSRDCNTCTLLIGPVSVARAEVELTVDEFTEAAPQFGAHPEQVPP